MFSLCTILLHLLQVFTCYDFSKDLQLAIIYCQCVIMAFNRRTNLHFIFIIILLL